MLHNGMPGWCQAGWLAGQVVRVMRGKVQGCRRGMVRRWCRDVEGAW